MNRDIFHSTRRDDWLHSSSWSRAPWRIRRITSHNTGLWITMRRECDRVRHDVTHRWCFIILQADVFWFHVTSMRCVLRRCGCDVALCWRVSWGREQLLEYLKEMRRDFKLEEGALDRTLWGHYCPRGCGFAVRRTTCGWKVKQICCDTEWHCVLELCVL